MNPNINIQINITFGWTEMKSVYSNHLPSYLLFSLLISFYSEHILTKVIDSVPYRPVWSEYTVSASNPVRLTPLFRTEKNTRRIGIVPAKSDCTGR